MGSSHRTAPGAHPAAVRRRGSVLEKAILDATMDQLGSVGWNGLTIEGVAARAQTGKAAVYRRWSSKSDLVADALKDGLPPLDGLPDEGSLREDLLGLVRMMRSRMYSRSGQALRTLLDECDRAQAEAFMELIVGRVVEPGKALMCEIVRRGIRRGDVRPDATSELVVDVVPAMMMYRHKITGSDVCDADLVRVVDEIMVPLLCPRQGGAR
ncbi:putative HTH-type transcriptional regulator [Streptomyces sp. RB5]|uniref:Putative HTH-type transcriptional regulator n=1 Tax=Streptomyces smaragdinus TaxID=2585196 RepID=A0A7K0CPD4_9ACTN|nr:TetR/AcrR family transcriptional regulator [Streptomyces smaragdinus]MQY15347.1 putative HTH-type transcriptional regulator [Streptomyces smaragdinus]